MYFRATILVQAYFDSFFHWNSRFTLHIYFNKSIQEELYVELYGLANVLKTITKNLRWKALSHSDALNTQ